MATASPVTDVARDGQIGNSKGKGDAGLEDRWARKGLFRFTFNIQTIEERTILGTKEAHDHAFSHKTSNWGWAQFARRDHVYYKNSEVVREDGFLITVTITSSPEKPRMAEPISHIVPPVLVHAMGSLLDDPEHSDVVFHLHPSRRRAKGGFPEIRKIYAIRKILAARSEYFRLMFEGGFQEAEVEDVSDEDSFLIYTQDEAEVSGDEDDVQDPFLEDSDEDVYEDDDQTSSSPYPDYVQTPTDSSHRDYVGSTDYSTNENEEAEQNQLLGDEGGDAEANGEHPVSRRSRTRDADVAGSTEKRIESAYGDGEMEASHTPDALSLTQVNVASASASAFIKPSLQPPELEEPSVTAPSSARAKRERVRSGEALPHASSGQRVGRREPNRRKRRKVNVLDSAYPTFKALLFFLYTDTVEFAPLTSSFLPAEIAADDSTDGAGSVNLFGSSVPVRRSRDAVGGLVEEMAKAHHKRKAVIEAYSERNPDKPTPCSAKAMYKLADKLDIPDLKRRAQEHIAMSLTVHNIVWEVFSGFNTQYPDIRKMETDFLLKHWPQVKRSSAMKSIFLRSSAHPGLAEVWPHLLEYLEYRHPDVDDTEETPY